MATLVTMGGDLQPGCLAGMYKKLQRGAQEILDVWMKVSCLSLLYNV